MHDVPVGERELRNLAVRFGEAEARIRGLGRRGAILRAARVLTTRARRSGLPSDTRDTDLNRASLGLFRRDQQRSRCGCLEERGHKNRLTGGEGSVNVAVT